MPHKIKLMEKNDTTVVANSVAAQKPSWPCDCAIKG